MLLGLFAALLLVDQTVLTSDSALLFSVAVPVEVAPVKITA